MCEIFPASGGSKEVTHMIHIPIHCDEQKKNMDSF